MTHSLNLAQNKPRTLRKYAVPLILLALTGLALILRTWDLNSTPPWLWWDEATQGLDARSVLGGQFRVFFPSAMGKEPLYIYLTTPFVAAWDGQPFAVRLAGALLGALMVPALYAAGRALWPKRPTVGLWSGVIAAGLWTVNFWPQSINRIGFQVNPFPLILTVAVIGWLNYTRRPTRRRAMVFGLLAGLTLTTYLAARITPLLWVVLYLALPRPKRQALRPTLLWALLIGCLIAAPLVIHFALNPGDFFQRMGGFDTLQSWRRSACRCSNWLADSWDFTATRSCATICPTGRRSVPSRARCSRLEQSWRSSPACGGAIKARSRC
jgi:4-amino-4-deoxy-L-arabinose transferase-like glycosyltransferase